MLIKYLIYAADFIHIVSLAHRVAYRVVISPFTDKETDFQRRNFLKVTCVTSSYLCD